MGGIVVVFLFSCWHSVLIEYILHHYETTQQPHLIPNDPFKWHLRVGPTNDRAHAHTHTVLFFFSMYSHDSSMHIFVTLKHKN